MAETHSQTPTIMPGKYELIHELSKFFPIENASTIIAAGDDATVIQNNDNQTVISSKVFIENTHFDLTYFPLRHLGYKLATIVFTDILAMNAVPSQLMVSIAISDRFDLKMVSEILEGFAACCDTAHADLANLDLTTSREELIITATAVGECEPALLCTRKGATENELICVSGDFAAAYTGLLLLEREKKVFNVNPNSKPDFTGKEYLLRRQLKPEPRIDILEKLRQENIHPTAMTAVGDGIATAALQICRASSKGCSLFEEKLPMTELTFVTLKELDIVHTVAALNGGDDYELMFTIKQDDFEKIKNVDNISIIGFVKEESAGCNIVTGDNIEIPLKAQGFSQTAAK